MAEIKQGISNVRILDELKKQDRTRGWLANKTGINPKSLVYKLNNNSITADELLVIAKILNIDLEELKNNN